MNNLENIWRGTGSVGQPTAKQPSRRYQLLAKDFSSVEQAVPIAVVFGTPKPFAGVIVTPIFGFRSKKIKSSVGK